MEDAQYMVVNLHSYWLIAAALFLVVSSIGLGEFFWHRVFRIRRGLSVFILFFTGEALLSTFSVLNAFIFSFPINLTSLLLVLFYFFPNGIKQIESYRIKKFNLGSSGYKLLWIILFAILGVFFIRALMPPFTWDDIAYHFPVVREISLGKVSFPLLSSSPYLDFQKLFSQFYGNLPYGSEAYASILYITSFFHSSSAQLIYYINFLFFLGFAASFLKGQYALNLRTRLVVILLLATSYSISSLVSTGYVDINVLIYQFLGISLLLPALQKKDAAALYLSTFMIGFSLSLKYTSLYILPLYLLLVLTVLLRVASGRRLIVASKMVFAGAIAGGFWYVKNLLIYNNPVYPLYWGHLGIPAEMYSILVNQIGYGINRNFGALFNSIKINYYNDWASILSFLVVVVAVVLGRFHRRKINVWFFIFAICMYLVNFFFGNQESRFVLITPVIMILLLGQYINRYATIGLFLAVFIVFFSLRHIPLQWSIWSSMIEDLLIIAKNDQAALEVKKVGCAAKIVGYLSQQPEGTKALNFWDPYAAVFYEEEKVFYNFGGKLDYNNFKIPPDAKYLYINKLYKKDFLSEPDFHRDINPIERDSLEKNLIKDKKQIFQTGNCELYSLE